MISLTISQANNISLVRSTSFILLQGVPPTVSLEEVREAILQVRGVISLHELHIWQLSENKVIASVHITASRDHDFMPVAAEIQEALHHRGIHSSTIQPEYTEPARSGSVPRVCCSRPIVKTETHGSCRKTDALLAAHKTLYVVQIILVAVSNPCLFPFQFFYIISSAPPLIVV